MLQDMMTDIAEEIEKIEKVTGIKKKINAHEMLTKKIDECEIYIDKLRQSLAPKTVDTFTTLTDEEFIKMYGELEQMAQELNACENVEDKISIHNIILQNVAKCEQYLNNQKQEIVYIE
jgi:hypothetical protein